MFGEEANFVCQDSDAFPELSNTIIFIVVNGAVKVPSRRNANKENIFRNKGFKVDNYRYKNMQERTKAMFSVSNGTDGNLLG